VVADGQAADDPGDHEEQAEDLDEDDVADAPECRVLARGTVAARPPEPPEEAGVVRRADHGGGVGAPGGVVGEVVKSSLGGGGGGAARCLLESHPEFIDRRGRALKVRVGNADTISAILRPPLSPPATTTTLGDFHEQTEDHDPT